MLRRGGAHSDQSASPATHAGATGATSRSASASVEARHGTRTKVGAWEHPQYGAALLAAGAVAGLPPLAAELALQLPQPAQPTALLAICVCGGLALGFWYPRHVVRRHLAEGHSRRDATGGSRTDHMLAAIFLILLAGFWLGAALLVSWAEEWRAFLCRTTLLPVPVTTVLAPAPLMLAIAGIGGIAAIALLALHACARHGSGAVRRVGFWLWISIGAGAAPLLVRISGGLGGAWLAALLALAGAVGALLGARRIQRAPAHPVSFAVVPRTLYPALLRCGLLGALLAPPLHNLPVVSAAGAIAAAGLLGGAVLKLGLSSGIVAVLELAALPLGVAVASVGLWCGPHPAGLVPVLLLGAVSTVVVLALAGRAVGRAAGSTQSGVAVPAQVACLALVGALAAHSMLSALFGVPRGGAVLVVGLSAAALPLAGGLRPAVLVAAALGAAVFGTLRLAPRAERVPPTVPASALADDYLALAGNQVIHASLDVGAARSAWNLDFGGARADVIVLHDAGALDTTNVGRTSGRVSSALLPGGCVLICDESGAVSRSEDVDRLIRAICGRLPAIAGNAVERRRLRMARGAERFEAVALGYDLRARIAQRPHPEGVMLRLEPLADTLPDSHDAAGRP